MGGSHWVWHFPRDLWFMFALGCAFGWATYALIVLVFGRKDPAVWRKKF